MNTATWVLCLYMGISSWGAGQVSKFIFPTEASCHKELETMRIDESKMTSGEDDEQIVAVCVPNFEK